ncbi:MAG TPA: hypothetical protein VKX17_01210 [Planctomycetota bacterium]|nr:hypothetical protein [Planctomycetota bacterium]
MTNPPLILKIAAVASSLALAGGYIWFETGKRTPRAAASAEQSHSDAPAKVLPRTVELPVVATTPKGEIKKNATKPAIQEPVLDSGLITVEDILQLSRSLFPVTKPDLSDLHVLPENQRPIQNNQPAKEEKPLIDHKTLDILLPPPVPKND